MISRHLIATAAIVLSAAVLTAKTENKKNGDSVLSRLAKSATETSSAKSGSKKDTAKQDADKDKKSKETESSGVKVEFSDTPSSVTDEIRKADSEPGTSSARKALIVSISGQLSERGDTVALFSRRTNSLKDYLDLFRKAREDKNIGMIVIRLGSSEYGLGMAHELRHALKELSAKGKKTLAIVEDDSQSSYLVALACDEIIVPPSGDLMLFGIKSDSYFLRGLLEKFGVTVQVVHMGQYKSYGETFTNDDYTTPARQNMTEIVDDIFEQYVDAIMEGRKVTREAAEAALNHGPVNADDAKELKLIDRAEYTEAALASIKKDGYETVLMSDYTGAAASKDSDVSLFSLLSLVKKTRDSGSSSESDSGSKYPKVAVLYAVGPIVLGGSEGVGFGGEEEIASNEIIANLEEIRKDDKIKAVILRVNSPGGSAFASDLIWRKIEEVKREKPVIASMSDVAASGGYYISMAATKIIAEPGTLTGSIGVVGGKPNFSGLYDKAGVRKTTIAKGDFAQLFSETSSFNEKERALIEKMMKRTYDDFVTKAARGRKTTYEKLHEVAQGRVWSGTRAKEVGLVDELGGMGKAIKETKALLGLKNDEKVALVAYPKEMTLFDYLSKAMGGGATASLKQPSMSVLISEWELLPAGLRQAFSTALSVSRMFRSEQVLAVMPALPRIEF